MNDETKSVSAKPDGWEQAILFINGNEIPEGEYIVFHHGKENSVTVELPTAMTRELSLKLANDGGLDITASPDFGSPVHQVDGKFNWQITLGAEQRGQVALVLESPDIDLPWHLPLNLSGEGMDKALELPIFTLREGLSEFLEVRFDGRTLPGNQKALATRYGRHTITLMPKSGVAGRKVRLGVKENPGLDLEIIPRRGVYQTLDPVNGATWTMTCPGDDGQFSLEAELGGVPSSALEIPVSLQAGYYHLSFQFLGYPQPYPPMGFMAQELVPGAGLGFTPEVLVTTYEGSPVSGIQVEFISPEHLSGIGTTGARGVAVSSMPVIYFPQQSRILEFLAKTREHTGRVSMIRFRLMIIPAKPIPSK